VIDVEAIIVQIARVNSSMVQEGISVLECPIKVPKAILGKLRGFALYPVAVLYQLSFLDPLDKDRTVQNHRSMHISIQECRYLVFERTPMITPNLSALLRAVDSADDEDIFVVSEVEASPTSCGDKVAVDTSRVAAPLVETTLYTRSGAKL
jgi:hypothetical protein